MFKTFLFCMTVTLAACASTHPCCPDRSGGMRAKQHRFAHSAPMLGQPGADV